MIDIKFINVWKRIKSQWKIAFVGAFVVGILTHMFVMTNNFLTPDTTWNIYSDQDMTYLGRQFLQYACKISSYYNLPWLNGVLAILYISITSSLVVEAFYIESKVISAIVGALMVTFPTVASTFCYIYTIDGYMLAMLLAVLSFLITDRRKKGFVFGAILLGISLGIYQAYFSMTILLCVLSLLLLILKGEKARNLWDKIWRYLVMGVTGYLFYVVTLKIMMHVKNVTATGYQGTDKVLGNPFLNIKEGLYASIKTFASFGIKANVLTTTTSMSIAYVTIVAVGIILFVLLFIRNKCYINRINIFLCVLLIAMIPIGSSIVAVMEPNVFFHLLMRMPWVLLFSFVLALVELYSMNDNEDATLRKRFIPYLAILCTVVMVFEFAVESNIVYFTLNERYEKSYGLCLRIVDRLEHTEDYKTGDPVALMGGVLDKEYYPETCITWMELSGYFDPNGESVINSTGKLSDFAYHYLGCTIMPASYEQHGIVANSKEYLEMDKFPSEESIKNIAGIWVIKING